MLLQLANDLRFTAQKSLACGARLSKGRSENNEAILERTSGILLEQKLGQSFDNFMRSAASVGRAQKYLFMWLENLYWAARKLANTAPIVPWSPG